MVAYSKNNKGITRKLVRDRVPELMETAGHTCVTGTLSDEDYLHLLELKLNEELAKYQDRKSLEELAELIEVILAVVKARGWSIEQLKSMRYKKAASHGTYEHKTYLVQQETEDSVVDDLMARTMVENLSVGIDPLSGRALSARDSCANEMIQEALKTVLDNCTVESYGTMLTRQRQEKKEKTAERKRQYTNAGTAWTKEEEDRLRLLFQSGTLVEDITKILKRTPRAIEDRLVKLRLMKRCDTSNYEVFKKYAWRHR